MGLARSTYYARSRSRRAARDSTLRADIEAVLVQWPQYGYRRVTKELQRRGARVNHKRVARIMRAHALTRRRVRRFLGTTNSRHGEPVFPNLAPTLVLTGPNQLWVADLTYIRLREDFVFLAVILDAWSRRVVGYAISQVLDTRLPLAALDVALAARQPAPGLVHHSDRGMQYASTLYRRRLDTHGIVGSMSRAGNPYDNAIAESFMKTLKYEEIYVHDYSTMEHLLDHLPHFLDELYNRQRLHSTLGYRPPEEFETLNLHPAA
jgi:putative transposase